MAYQANRSSSRRGSTRKRRAVGRVGQSMYGGPAQAKKGAPMYGAATAHFGTPGKPPAVGVGAQPPDPGFEAWKAQQGLQTNLNNAEALYQQGQIGQDTGYNAAGQIDASNPYSKAALLKENYKRSQLGTTNNYGSRRLLYSGAYQTAQGENTRNYSIGSDELQRSAANQYHGIAQGQAQAGINAGVGLTDQQRQALYRALGVG